MCCLVNETVGSKWLANQIWSGMKVCPEGKHQVPFVFFLFGVTLCFFEYLKKNLKVFQGQIY